MIAVIGTISALAYRHTMAGPDDIQRVAATLERPEADYWERLELARAATMARSGEAARQLGVFAERIRDLTIDELPELYDETFRRGSLTGIEPLTRRLARRSADSADARTAVNALVPALDHLEADRNPFAYAVKALCCVLLVRANPASSPSTFSEPLPNSDRQ